MARIKTGIILSFINAIIAISCAITFIVIFDKPRDFLSFSLGYFAAGGFIAFLFYASKEFGRKKEKDNGQ